MTNTFRISALLIGASLLAMGGSGTALAQDAAAAPQGDALSDIVVTANRREENLQKVPVSVAVISGNQLRNYTGGGDDTLLTLAGRVPSLYVESTTGRIFPRFYIRGLGNIDFYLGASQPVTIIQDDVVLEHVVLKSNPVYDVNQVEVLRGPQGSLFGRNTTAGIIKFDTARPTQTWQGQAQATYGTYNTATLDAGIGGPIVQDKIAFRLSGLVQHRDNYVDNTYTGPSADGTVSPKKDVMGGFDEKDVRLQLLLTPTDRLSILASGHARDYSGTSTLFLRNALTKGTNVSNASRTSVAFDEADNNPQAYHTYGGSVNASYDLGVAKLTSITAYETTHGYSRGDTDGGFRQLPLTAAGGCIDCGESQGRIRRLGQWTQEVRLASQDDGAFKWQVGGFYFDSRDITEFDQRRYFLTAPFVAANSNTNNPGNYVVLHDVNTSWAGFGQISYTLDKLTITGGARYTEDRKHTTLLQAATTGTTVNFPATAPRDVKLVGKEPSWDVSALYAASSAISLYARVADGFRGPTIQGRSAVFGSPFTTANSEKNLSGEVGIKTKLLDDRVHFNLTGFGYRVKNIQLNGNDANGNGVLFNARKAVAYGAEAELEVRPVRNLTLSAGASYLHSEIKDKNVYAQVCALNGQVVCTVLDPTIVVRGTTYAQINGDPLPNAPKYNINLSAHYDIPVTASSKLFIESDFNLQGYTQFVLYKTLEFNSNGNFEAGAKLGYDFAGGKYQVAVFARNITNAKNLKGVIENYMAAVYNDPRIIGVSLGARFR
ncbi:TonB-dependent receptor [Sphingomonas nostoxanthinifaciens]|uniref:TonB-dependent receptor n=1 Tax=Sphingomonas nostoxanthinifaciens TaxID=2872652 RepID=UPI001CC1F646|nr:TonB-dependent receptor [Sphingomonas nostoxanthinifaciens]UAK25206.1 TonB-dependent receptor [Sphingomonas nostoxanthinifaciens]